MDEEDDFPIKPYDFGEDRETVNQILVAIFSHTGYPFDLAAGGREELKNIDPLYMLQNAPGLLHVFTVAAYVKKGKLSRKEEGWMDRIIEGLFPILIRAFQGDEAAETQLKAIDKLIYPDTYELPKTIIEDLAERYHTRAPLARGWRVRELMGGLSRVVKPARSEAKNILDGAVKLRDESQCKGNTIYIQSLKKRVSTYETAKKHWKRGVTLQNLAIRVYLEDLQAQGFEGIDERTLKRDLKEVEKWEETLPSDQRQWGVLVVTPGKDNVHLPVGNYSEGWKQRKRAKSPNN